ncbi:MAG TPA: ATP-binding cassette domain-containing protein, partial [Streptosporangiaceae bacterium]|nr:ATP-binding cassette domain-containing protein [Streptosporangiaceae bacterium]
MCTDTPHQHGGRPDPGQEPALVRVEGVAKRYGEAGAETVVLTNTSLELVRGQTTSLVGVSGSGKSTLLGLIAGLMQPDSGRIVIDGQDITR